MTFKKNKNKINSISRFKRGLVSILAVVAIVFSSYTNVKAQEFLNVYTAQPGLMVSDVTGGTLETEDFSGFSGLPSYSWAPSPAGYVSTIGTYYQTGGQSYIKQDDQYGAGTSNYMAIKVGGIVRIVFNNPVQYFGFAWPAGDGSNTIKILRNSIVIGTFATSDIIALLPNSASNFITSINGTNYSTDSYYGKPGTGQNAGEPYSYLHFVSSAGLAFDEIELSMGGGGNFENDNHSIISTGTPNLQGGWVELISINTPTTVDDNDSGFIGQTVDVDVLANDSPGDAPIDVASVQIVGTAGPGLSLVVPGEGQWDVNTTNGYISFTPEFGYTGNPTPIEYSVNDTDGYSSNVSSVTITYTGGPTANDDSAITPLNTAVDINVLNNDVAGTTPIVPSTVSFIGGTEPNPATEGVFTVNPSGLVTFTPVNGFLGTVTIDYQVCDQNTICSTATITVSVLTGTTNLYPALGFGTLGFEDLWPSKGDYDFNDLVIDYQFEINSNIYNYVDDVYATFTIKAFGASFENGFGFQLASAINPSDVTVTGSHLKENIITLEANGTESGQTKTTIIVYDNAFKEMQHPGIGIGVNTDPSAPYVAPVTIVIHIVFANNTYTLNDLDIANFNPFIFVNKYRPTEVHLADYPPTDLADQGLFGIYDDDSDPSIGRYYKTEDNLPWAINTYETFAYPKEKIPIVSALLKFALWANSGGTLFQDWYKDLPNYRDNSKIYTHP